MFVFVSVPLRAVSFKICGSGVFVEFVVITLLNFIHGKKVGSTTPPNPNAREKAITAILKEYKKAAAAKISLQELQKAKENIKGKMALLLEQSDAQASFYGLQELLEKKTLSPEEIYDKINAVSRDDILELAQDIFRPHGLNLAIVGPGLNKKQMQSLLFL